MKQLKTIFARFKERAESAKVQRSVLAAAVTAFALAPAAMASEGTTGSSGMPAVLGAFETVTSLMNYVWTLMTSNPLLTLFLAAGLLSIGVQAFRQIKRAAKGG